VPVRFVGRLPASVPSVRLVAQVAAETGPCDLSHFSRMFWEVTARRREMPRC